MQQIREKYVTFDNINICLALKGMFLVYFDGTIKAYFSIFVTITYREGNDDVIVSTAFS